LVDEFNEKIKFIREDKSDRWDVKRKILNANLFIDFVLSDEFMNCYEKNGIIT
jgi:hypothetical protein